MHRRQHHRSLENERQYSLRWQLYLGSRLLQHVTTEDLRRVQVKMRDKRKWSNGTINRHFRFLRRVLMIAVKDGKLKRNPVSAVRCLPEEHRTSFLSDEEIAHLRQHICTEHWNAVAFAIEIGLRRVEQFNLRWNQVNLEAGMLTIRRVARPAMCAIQ